MKGPSHVIDYESIALQKDMTYIQKTTQTLDRREQVLWPKSIPLVNSSSNIIQLKWQFRNERTNSAKTIPPL